MRPIVATDPNAAFLEQQIADQFDRLIRPRPITPGQDGADFLADMMEQMNRQFADIFDRREDAMTTRKNHSDDRPASDNQRVIFAVAKMTDHTAPLIMIGIPEGAYADMDGEKTQHFDLTPAGLPVKVMLYRTKDHARAVEILREAGESLGIPLEDHRKEDHGIKD